MNETQIISIQQQIQESHRDLEYRQQESILEINDSMGHGIPIDREVNETTTIDESDEKEKEFG